MLLHARAFDKLSAMVLVIWKVRRGGIRFVVAL